MNDEKLSRIENKLDAVNERLGSIDVTLAKQHEQLTYHIKRTDLLEQKVEKNTGYIYMGLGIAAVAGYLVKAWLMK